MMFRLLKLKNKLEEKLLENKYIIGMTAKVIDLIIINFLLFLNSNSNIIKTPPRKTNTEKALKTYTETLTGKILTESTKNKNINHAISEHQAAQLFNLFLLLNLTKYPIYSVMRFSSTNA
ncbi:hypothetical protein K6072_004394 [Escherichia coli]|nr:hypothetical protein [Escherichia coli]EJJ1148205.1 hypothetical protein [Escherichia coli]